MGTVRMICTSPTTSNGPPGPADIPGRADVTATACGSTHALPAGTLLTAADALHGLAPTALDTAPACKSRYHTAWTYGSVIHKPLPSGCSAVEYAAKHAARDGEGAVQACCVPPPAMSRTAGPAPLPPAKLTLYTAPYLSHAPDASSQPCGVVTRLVTLMGKPMASAGRHATCDTVPASASYHHRHDPWLTSENTTS
jgi:hypothetical protein